MIESSHEMAVTMKTTSRLSRMLQRLDIDVTRGLDLNMPLVARAAIICGTCTKSDECEIWLRSGKQDHGYRKFCPNAARLDCMPRSSSIFRADRVA